MIYIIVLAIVAILIFGVYVKKNLEKVNEEIKRQQQEEQPVKFELLDDNGDPISERPSEPVVQELEYFCIRDKGYHVSVWAKDAGIQNLDYIEFPIAGISHRENIGNYLGEHLGTMEEEPDNPYDANAIKILAGDKHHLGYVPRDYIFDVRKFTTFPCKCYVYIGENDGVYYSDCYIKK